jgi:hypothetical protein
MKKEDDRIQPQTFKLLGRVDRVTQISSIECTVNQEHARTDQSGVLRTWAAPDVSSVEESEPYHFDSIRTVTVSLL